MRAWQLLAVDQERLSQITSASRRASRRFGLLPGRFRVGETLPMEYVPPEAFGEDYLYFYDAFLTDDVSEAQADRLWRLLELESGDEVLDVPCGHGRIANALAARGATVTGLDANPLFLERARTDAAARGVNVEYIQGDMREERFDLVLNWFTSFGYSTTRATVPGSARHARRSDREVASSSNSGIATRSPATGCP
jgi:2-polyprenyl-3-methyl-5-hydroxy-6-metoxy-1,4-benzoquinol methylase